MKNLIKLAIAITIFSSACTESFNPKLDSTFEKLVVQGSISDERKAHQVSLSKSADYFSNKPAERVKNAIVTISDGENTFNLTEISDGLYETDTLAGEPGKTYTLSINTEGRDYTSSCFLNDIAPIDSINFGYYDFGDNSSYQDSSLWILLNALEPATPDNFYLWNTYKNGVLESDTLFEVYFSDDIFVNGNYLTDIPVQNVKIAEVGDTIMLEMQAITEEYYNYINQVLTVTIWNAGPLGNPPANPVGNIFEVNDNGNDNDNPLGFFLAYSIERITDTVPEEDEWIELEFF